MAREIEIKELVDIKTSELRRETAPLCMWLEPTRIQKRR